MPTVTYRPVTIEDYEAAYALWIRCGGVLNDKDDPRKGIGQSPDRDPGTSFVSVTVEKGVGGILCGHDGR